MEKYILTPRLRAQFYNQWRHQILGFYLAKDRAQIIGRTRNYDRIVNFWLAHFQQAKVRL
jgi:hypothetical protein